MAAFKELKVELILFLLLPIAFGDYFFFLGAAIFLKEETLMIYFHFQRFIFPFF